MANNTEKSTQGSPRMILGSEQWFLDNVKNNPKEIAEVCKMTARSMHEQASIRFENPNSTPAFYAMVVDRTFMSIVKYLAKMQACGYPRYTIMFGNNFNIGYQDDDNKDSEKIGNFIPVLEYGVQNKSIVPAPGVDSEDVVINSYKRWMELNVKQCIEETTWIASDAFDHLLNEDNLNLRYKEAIVPIFCTFIDMIVEVLKFKYQERKDADQSQVSIDVFGLFYAYYWFDEEDQGEVIEFEPGIKLKQDMKSDKFAGGSDK